MSAKEKCELDTSAPWRVRFAHWIGWCPRVTIFQASDGIGGMCIDCGKIHGWITDEELFAAVAPDKSFHEHARIVHWRYMRIEWLAKCEKRQLHKVEYWECER